jgi:hypothetical protein
LGIVGKGHYQFVGSICKQINKIYANEHEDSTKTIWKHVTVSEDLAELCLCDHQKLGQRRNEIQILRNGLSNW